MREAGTRETSIATRRLAWILNQFRMTRRIYRVARGPHAARSGNAPNLTHGCASPAAATVSIRPLASAIASPPVSASSAAIGLEPARPAGPRQPPLADDDVGLGAGAVHLGDVDQIGRSRRQHAPAPPAAHQIDRAQVRPAARARAARRSPPPRRNSRHSRRASAAHNRPRAAAAAPAARSASRTAMWRPSPVTSRSGGGVASAQAAPISSGTSPSRRTRVRHSASHSPPADHQRDRRPAGIDGSAATAPGRSAT